MWEALIAKNTSKMDPDADATTITGRIRHYLRSHPHRTAKQVADALGITQTQANTSLNYMSTTGAVFSALDDSTERPRLTNHYSVRS